MNALFPVDEDLDFAVGTNSKIRQVNESLARLVGRYPNVVFIDNRRQFIDSEGQLRSDYHIGDGLHLNTSGYEVWINRLRSTLADVTDLQID